VHENSQHVVKHWLLASHSIEVVERTYIWHSIYSTLILCRYPYTIDFLIQCHEGGRAFIEGERRLLVEGGRPFVEGGETVHDTQEETVCRGREEAVH